MRVPGLRDVPGLPGIAGLPLDGVRLPDPVLPHLPRSPVGPDPFRRIRVPRDLDAVTTIAPGEASPADGGMTRAGVERIWHAVRRLYASGFHPAIALTVRRHGVPVLDRAIGHARGNAPGDPPEAPREPVTPDTPFVIFSAAKAVTATIAHLLDERGLIHTDDRVCEYIPEYGTHGKEAITIEHVLSHRAGVPNLPREALELDRVDDHRFLLRALCETRPTTRPGKLLAYHAISGGYIIAEIVRRVTGEEIRAFAARELLGPLGFRWGNFGVAAEDVPLVAHNAATGMPVLPPLSTILARALGQSPDTITAMANDPRFLTGVIPSATVVTTAGELSRFFELLRQGGELDGVRVMEARTVRRAIVERAYRELDLTLGAPLRHSSGFMLGARALSLFGPDTELAFGHLGFTNVLGWADPERAISVGLVNSGKPVVNPWMPELWTLARAIGEAAPKVARPGLSLMSRP